MCWSRDDQTSVRYFFLLKNGCKFWLRRACIGWDLLGHLLSSLWYFTQAYLLEKTENGSCDTHWFLLKTVWVGPMKKRSHNDCKYGFIRRARSFHRQVSQSATPAPLSRSPTFFNECGPFHFVKISTCHSLPSSSHINVSHKCLT